MAPGTAKKSRYLDRSTPATTADASTVQKGGTRNGNQRKAAQPVAHTRAEIREMAESLGRLADEGRLRILFLLEEASYNVAALGEALGQDRHSLSHHLRILRVSGLIQSTRDGRRVDYSLTPHGRLGVKAARSVVT